MTDTPAVPPSPSPAFGCARFSAPASWQAIDFLSDLHLSESTPRTVAALAAHLRCTGADAVFILGDLFEVWVGDDARHDGFEAECVAMLREAASRRVVGFMAGNRDFLVGEETLRESGVIRLEDPTLITAFGQQLLVSHGDALCLDDTEYQRFRAEVRAGDWQQRFLAQPLAERRRVAASYRAQSEARKRGQSPADWSDLDPAATRAWLQSAGAPALLHGHTHQPATHTLGPGLVRHVLSDWDFDDEAAPRGDVLRWTRDGLARVAPARDC